MNLVARFFKDLLVYWRSILLFVVPFGLLPIPLSHSSAEVRCAYIVAVMAIYWIFELIPIPVTALLPVFMFPLLGVLSTGDAAAPYFSKSNFLFFGGLIIALAVEEVNLHKRLALKVLLGMGSDPKWIMFGFMWTAWFLSMWMSNTATTAMMLPIAMAVIQELIKFRHHTQPGSMVAPARLDSELPIMRSTSTQPESPGLENPADSDPNYYQDRKNWKPEDWKLAKAILLCLCYSANIGGTGTLTGTVPNVIALGQLDKAGIEGVTYANWMAFQIPAAAVFLVITWLWLQIWFFPPRLLLRCQRHSGGGLTKILKHRYQELGSMSFGEYLVTLIYVFLVGLWILRDPKFIPGWGGLFPKGFISDAVPAVLVAVLLFMLPREAPDFLCFKSRNRKADPKKREPLMNWDAMKRFPWDVIVIIGGGFSMAAGVTSSGLATFIANALQHHLAGSVSPGVFCAVVVTFVTFFTEVTSNSSTANIFIPILISVAQGLGVHPFYLALPVTIACSLAFMIPVATPPNAIVFGSGVLKMKDMMMTGFVLNWIGIAVTLFGANFYTPLILDMTWAGNNTLLIAGNATNGTF